MGFSGDFRCHPHPPPALRQHTEPCKFNPIMPRRLWAAATNRLAAATSVAAHGRRSDGPAIGAVETKGDWSKRAATLISPNAPSFKHLRRSVGQGPGPRLGCAQFQRCCPIPSSRGVPGGSRDARPAKSRLRELALACRFAAEPAPRRPENTAAERGRRRKRLPSAETQSEFLSPRARARDPNAQRLYGGFQPFIDLGRGPSSRWRGSGPWLPVQEFGHDLSCGYDQAEAKKNATENARRARMLSGIRFRMRIREFFPITTGENAIVRLDDHEHSSR